MYTEYPHQCRKPASKDSHILVWNRSTHMTDFKAEQPQQPLHPKEQRRANLAIVVALGAAGLAAWQAWETHLARTDSAKALGVAQNALDVSTKQFRFEHRPKLEFSDYTADTDLSHHTISAVVVFVNNGKIEAKNVKVKAQMEIVHYDDRDNRFVVPLMDKDISSMTPTMTFNILFGLKQFTAQEFQDTQTGRVHIYFTAVFEYADEFGEHYSGSKWCGQYSPGRGQSQVFISCRTGVAFDSSR